MICHDDSAGHPVFETLWKMTYSPQSKGTPWNEIAQASGARLRMRQLSERSKGELGVKMDRGEL